MITLLSLRSRGMFASLCTCIISSGLLVHMVNADGHVNGDSTMVATWNEFIDFVWDETHTREDYLASGQLIPNMNTITGVKIAPLRRETKQDVYLTIPRWFEGTPSTLNKITLDLTADEPAVDLPLQPWPSWEWQEMGGDCSGLQYVQSMEIDRNGHMWVLDNGRTHIFTANPDNTCPPRLVIFDAETGELIDEPYVFPESVISYTEAFLNDIVVDTDRNVAYISETNSETDYGALLVYDRNARTSRRIEDPTMNADRSVRWVVQGGVDLGYDNLNRAVNSIAMLADGSRVYYAPMQGLHVYSVATSSLRGDEGALPFNDTLIDHGRKQPPTDGMTMDCAATLYYGGEDMAAVLTWGAAGGARNTPIQTSEILFQDFERGWWVDTFAWDRWDHVWWTVNNLPDLFFNGTASPVYIWRHPTSTGSYIQGPCARAEDSAPEEYRPNMKSRKSQKEPGLSYAYSSNDSSDLE